MLQNISLIGNDVQTVWNYLEYLENILLRFNIILPIKRDLLRRHEHRLSIRVIHLALNGIV